MNENKLKRLNQYRTILQKEPQLFEISEMVYKDMVHLSDVQAGITSYVIAPVMYRFVSWVLNEAVKSNKKRLYFLARDGYSMYHVAKVLCEKANLPIECKYLYCSRYALRSAQFYLMGEESLDYVCLGGMDVTFEKMMHRAGLSYEKALEVAKLLELDEKMDVHLSYNEIKAMRQVLKECSLFMESMKEYAGTCYPLVTDYLKQEGLMDDVSFAIVDSGWTGSMQKSLQSLVNSRGKNITLEGYYFGMYEYPKDCKKETYHCFYFEPDSDIRRKVYFNNNLFECIFSSPEGMATGYKFEEGKYEPVFEHKENPNYERIEYSTGVLVKYAELILEKYPTNMQEDKDKFLIAASKLFYYFMGKPSKEEATEYGNYIFCDDVIGEENQILATRLSKREIRDNFLISKSMNMLLKTGKPIKESAWIEGSTVLNEDMGRGKLSQCALCKYALYVRKRMK